MRFLAASVLLSCICAVWLHADEPSISQNLFRGIPYGTTVEEMTAKGWDLTPVNDSNREKAALQAYIRNDEKKSFGDITCDEITYYFLNEKFYGVLLQTVDGTQTEILKEAICAKRGRPLLTTSGLVWIGQNSSVILRLNGTSGEGTFLLFDNNMQSLYEKYVREAGGAASREL